MPSHAPDLHGLLVLDKPGRAAGSDAAAAERLPTSHDVVQWVRRWSGQRRIGHTGTLDPMASGVLVLCLGRATRLVEYYQGHDKRYLAEVRLGAATDTYDATGQVMETAPVPALDSAAIEAALAPLRGDIMQTPPAYSALKQGGESAHYKARRGEAVALAPRPVTIFRLDLLAWTPPDRIALRVRCSAGGYMRSLAHDLGAALGTAAHLAALRREAAGPFTLEHAHTPERAAEAAAAGELAGLLLPAGWGLDLPAVTLDAESMQRLGHGQQVWLAAPGTPETLRAGSLAQGYSGSGGLAGILRCLQATPDSALWKAEKWFAHE